MQVKSSILLEAFDRKIDQALSSFFYKHGGRLLRGAWENGQVVHRPYEFFEGKFFLWSNIFEFNNMTLDIWYGDRDSSIGTVIEYPLFQDEFSLWEILMSQEKEYALVNGSWVFSRESLDQILENISAALIENWDFISNPTESTIKDLRLAREKRINDASEIDEKNRMEADCIKASRFFHEGKKEKAYSLLKPYVHRSDLPKGSRLILNIIEKSKEN